MARQVREKSESGFYHIIVRGVNKQPIFEDDADKSRLLSTIARYKKELEFKLHAYCFMSNHIHLLIEDPTDRLSTIMKKILCSYVMYYNTRHFRTGHLFQDRFKSEAINDDSYYLTVVRYIHQNPAKAGIAATENYRWSSYSDYVSGGGVSDTDFALELLGGLTGFVEFNAQEETASCLEEKERLTDSQLEQLIKKIAQVEHTSDIKTLNKYIRNEKLCELKKAGIPVISISKLTGISSRIIYSI